MDKQGSANIPTCTCSREINYSDYILRDVNVRGLSDPEIQLDLLSDANQNMSFEEVLQFVEKKEAGDDQQTVCTRLKV